MIRIVPITPATAIAIMGRTPSRSFRGIAFEEDGRPIGCAGLYLDGAHQVMFFDGDAAAVCRSPKAVVRAILELTRRLASKGVPIYVHADENREASARMLEHFGFEHQGGRVYRWQP